MVVLIQRNNNEIQLKNCSRHQQQIAPRNDESTIIDKCYRDISNNNRLILINTFECILNICNNMNFDHKLRIMSSLTSISASSFKSKLLSKSSEVMNKITYADLSSFDDNNTNYRKNQRKINYDSIPNDANKSSNSLMYYYSEPSINENTISNNHSVHLKQCDLNRNDSNKNNNFNQFESRFNENIDNSKLIMLPSTLSSSFSSLPSSISPKLSLKSFIIILVSLAMMMMFNLNSFSVMANPLPQMHTNLQPKLLKLMSGDDVMMSTNIHDSNYNNKNYNNEQQTPKFGSTVNALRFKILNQLRLHNNNLHRRVHHNRYRQSHSRLNDPIFDPAIEEFSLDSRHASIPFMMSNNNPKFDDDEDIMDKQQLQSAKTIDNKLKESKNMENSDDEQTNDNNIIDSKQSSILDDDEGDTVQKIIDSGWIQHSSTKKLIYYLRKIDEVLYRNGLGSNLNPEVEDDDLVGDSGVDKILAVDGPNDDELNSSNAKENDSTNLNNNNNINNNSKSNESKNVDTLMENNKNFEIILNRVMDTPTVVKKRGEGPQLSIDYPLTVLRQRLVAELARRKAKETEEQIAINTEILKKLGRRRRSIPNVKKQIQGKKMVTNPNKYLQKQQQNFRKNDKYFDQYDKQKQHYIRINSKKHTWPIENRLQQQKQNGNWLK